MATATLARAHGSSVRHMLVVGTKTTHCGKDAALMARYSPADLPSGERAAGYLCESCRTAKQEQKASCACGAVNYPSCLCGLTPTQWVAAHPTRPLT